VYRHHGTLAEERRRATVSTTTAVTWPWFLIYGFGLLGVLVRRWWVVSVAAVTWSAIAFFFGFWYRWSDDGWGEFGVPLVVFFASLTVVASAVGPAIRTGLRLAKAS
jgi:hypothetical protein